MAATNCGVRCGWTLIRKTSLLRKINPMMRRSSFTNKGHLQLDHLAMNERRNVPEIVNGTGELLRRSQTRINLLFTMSEIPHAHPVGRYMRSDVSRTTLPTKHFLNEKITGDQTIWWSQTGSNRRPHACKARALPAELWPRTRRRMQRTRSKWWAWEDLNFRPHAYQARALTN